MKPMGKTTTTPQSGSAMVEAALVLLLGLALIIAIIDFGYVLMLRQAFVQRVRAGSRYAIVNDWDGNATEAENRLRNMIVYNDPDPEPRSGPGLLGLTPAMVTIVREDPGGSPGDEAADRIVVGISGYETLLFTPGVAGRFIGRPITQAIPVENLGAAF